MIKIMIEMEKSWIGSLCIQTCLPFICRQSIANLSSESQSYVNPAKG